MNCKTITVFDIAKVKSSNIESIAFGGDSIYVNFLNGTSYSYEGATLSEYEEFKKAESVGKHFHSHIKNADYKVEKLEEVELQLEKSSFSENESLLMAEVAQLKRERNDLYQALQIKQEQINILIDKNKELKKRCFGNV